MVRLLVVFIDGTIIDEEFPNHELELVEEMAESTPKELLCRVEIEDNTETLLYQYKRKTTYVY